MAAGRISKKPATVTDVALRLFFADLLDRNQIRPGELGRSLGFKNSNEIAKILKGNKNYSRKKLTETIETLVSKYNANRTFLETGHGSMYKDDKPYLAPEGSDWTLNDGDNIGAYLSKAKIKELQEEVAKLQNRLSQLEEVLKAKEETIELQRELLKKKK